MYDTLACYTDTDESGNSSKKTEELLNPCLARISFYWGYSSLIIAFLDFFTQTILCPITYRRNQVTNSGSNRMSQNLRKPNWLQYYDTEMKPIIGVDTLYTIIFVMQYWGKNWPNLVGLHACLGNLGSTTANKSVSSTFSIIVQKL